MKFIFVALAAALVLAGCASSPSPGATGPGGTVVPAATGGNDTNTASSTTAPSPEAGSKTAATNSTVTVNGSNVTSTPSVALKGTLRSFVGGCVFTPTFGTCESVSPSQATPGTTYLNLPTDARVRGGKIHVTYSGDTQVGVGIETYGAGNFKSILQKSGPSPLDVEVPAFDIPSGVSGTLYLFAVSQGSMTQVGGAYASASDIPVEAVGSITVEKRPSLPTHAVAYKFDGALPAFVETCVFPITCADLPPGAAFKNRDEPAVKPLAAKLTLTWTAASPATEKLAVGISIVSDRSSHSWSIVGTSPLTLELNSIAVPPGSKLVVFVSVPSSGVLVAYAAANPVEQPFAIAGTWTVAGP